MYDFRSGPALPRLGRPIRLTTEALYGGIRMEYRYLLSVSGGGVPPWYPSVIWILHNPPYALGEDPDPMSDLIFRRCWEITQHHKFMRMHIVSVLSLRSPDKWVMQNMPDPVGPGNFQRVEMTLRSEPGIVIAAWGCILRPFAPHFQRLDALLRSTGRRINALDLTDACDPSLPDGWDEESRRPESGSLPPIDRPLVTWIPGIEPYDPGQ